MDDRGREDAGAGVVPIQAVLVDAYTVELDPMPGDRHKAVMQVRRYAPGGTIPFEPGDTVRRCRDGTTVVIRTWHIAAIAAPSLRLAH